MFIDFFALSGSKFPAVEMLVELSIVAGNDFTGPHMPHGFADRLQVANYRSILSYADWVRQHVQVENNQVFKQEMVNVIQIKIKR